MKYYLDQCIFLGVLFSMNKKYKAFEETKSQRCPDNPRRQLGGNGFWAHSKILNHCNKGELQLFLEF